MKKLNVLTRMLLLVALLVGSVSAWATPETYTFSSIPTTGWTTSGGSNAINGKSWTYSSSTYIGCSDGSKIQVGSKKNPQTSDWTIRIPVSSFGSGKAITNVTITAYTTEASATYDISVGETSYSSGSLTTSSSDYSTGDINVTSGNIVVTMTGSSTSKAMYLSDISVTYDDATTDPVINASNVNIDAEDTEGSISFNITNPVAETHLSATITEGGTWLSNATVDEAKGKVTFTSTVNDDTENSREGTIRLVYGNNLVTKDVTITQAAMPLKYTVTYTTEQENGTLVIKNGDDVVTSGSSFAEGTILNIITTPAENYAFRNWQYRREGGSWVTNTTATTYTMTDKNVEFRANFDFTYPVNFSVNGHIASTARFAEDKKIDFPGSVTEYDGYSFIGWTETPVVGTVADEPTLVNTASETMGTEEKTYYAVFVKTTSAKATFDPNDLTDTPSSGTRAWTHTATGTSIYLSAGQHYTGGTPKTFTVTASTANTTNYLQVTAPTGFNLSKITVTISGTNYKIGSVSTGASLSTSGTTQTVTFSSDLNSVQCNATTNNQIRATSIVVETEKVEEAYCTSIPVPVTITDLSAIDGSKYTGKNYATLYYSDVALAVPSGVKAYTYKIEGGNLTVSRTYENGGTYPVIPAGEAVVVESDAGASYNFNVSTTETTVDTNSLLKGTDASTTIDESGYKYYKLAMNDALTSVGFYFAVAGGASITNGAHKAYLAVPVGGDAKNFFVLGGEDEANNETTAINAVDIAIANGATIYNLAGQKVGANYKGIVVINGKKVVRK